MLLSVRERKLGTQSREGCEEHPLPAAEGWRVERKRKPQCKSREAAMCSAGVKSGRRSEQPGLVDLPGARTRLGGQGGPFKLCF